MKPRADATKPSRTRCGRYVKCTSDVPAGTVTAWIRPSRRTAPAWWTALPPWGAVVMTVACHPEANCSERTKVALCGVVTRNVSSPQAVLDTTWTVAKVAPPAPPCTQARPWAEPWVKTLKSPIIPR